MPNQMIGKIPRCSNINLGARHLPMKTSCISGTRDWENS